MADRPDPIQIRREFKEAVNMTARALERWLATDESRSVGMASGEKKTSKAGGESTGHRSGRRIVELLGTKVADLDDDDLAQMRRVTTYVRRHLAQGAPKGDVEHSRWRYSLMNWGHDPLNNAKVKKKAA